MFIISILCVSSIKCQIIPDWFLHPSKGEFVGVSCLSDDVKTKQKMALTSALLSYVATSVNSNSMGECVSHQYSVKSGKFFEKCINRCLEDAYIRYNIIREYTNDFGELFIAICIEPDSTAYFEVSGEEKLSFEKTDNEERHERKMFMKCSYIDGILDKMVYKLSYTMMNDDELGEIEMAYDSFYNKTKFNTKHIYPNVTYSMRNCGWRYSCNNSLHLAYVQILLAHISSRVKLTYPISLIDNYLISYRYD